MTNPAGTPSTSASSVVNGCSRSAVPRSRRRCAQATGLSRRSTSSGMIPA
nr:hypothetical protein [Micromonospora sp. 4G55]